MKNQEHIIEITKSQKDQLIKWLENPSGSFNFFRAHFEAVEKGGILIRTFPRFQ